MKVTVVGTGYVGLVTGARLSEIGNHVMCLDLDECKIRILNEGGIPIHEPGLDVIVKCNVAAGWLQFTTDVAAAVAHGTFQFISVGTPPDEYGSADLQYVLAAATSIGRLMTDYKVIVDKSTVPVGTADKVRAAVKAALDARGLGSSEFAVVSNPEFLKEGEAVEECMRPDRIVIGADDERAVLLMRSLYTPFMRNHDRMQVTDERSAEFTKYAANAMLATRISFMNELALLVVRVGVDIEAVRKGIGTDPRIGTHFLYLGTGYGGSCFPKDVKELILTGRDNGMALSILQAVEDVNERQKQVPLNEIVAQFGDDLTGCSFAMWVLAFKPNTDDMREAPGRVIAEALTARGASIRAYDPVAMPEAARIMRDLPRVSFVSSQAWALPGGRRAGHRDRVKGVPQPGLRRHQGGAQAAADFRQSRSARPQADGDAGHRLPGHRARGAKLKSADRRCLARLQRSQVTV